MARPRPEDWLRCARAGYDILPARGRSAVSDASPRDGASSLREACQAPTALVPEITWTRREVACSTDGMDLDPAARRALRRRPRRRQRVGGGVRPRALRCEPAAHAHAAPARLADFVLAPGGGSPVSGGADGLGPGWWRGRPVPAAAGQPRHDRRRAHGTRMHGTRGDGAGRAGAVPQIEAHGRDLVSYWEAAPAQGDVDDPALLANRLARRPWCDQEERGGVPRCRCRSRRTCWTGCGTRYASGWTATASQGGPTAFRSEHLAAYGVMLRQLDLDEPDGGLRDDPPEYTPSGSRPWRSAGPRPGRAASPPSRLRRTGPSPATARCTSRTRPALRLAWQENTLVMPEHRGHRLGLALKEATHRLLQAEFPEVRATARLAHPREPVDDRHQRATRLYRGVPLGRLPGPMA